MSLYAWPHSYQIGDTLQLFVNATSTYTLSGTKIGPQGPTTIFREAHQPPFSQPDRYSLRYGCGWKPSHSLPTQGLTPGFYVFRVASDDHPDQAWNTPVLLRSQTGSKVVVVSPSNTWQAYNPYGGKSNYDDAVTPKAVQFTYELLSKISAGSRLAPYTYLPEHRPYQHKFSTAPLDAQMKSLDGKISSDLYLIEFLESLNISYDVISDGDFAQGLGFDEADLIIFHNHSEYWAYESMGMLKQQIDQGVSVLFLSGNNIYRHVERVHGNTLKVIDQQTDRAAVEPIVGTYYSDSGYEEPLASFRVVNEAHWIFAGTDLQGGDLFGAGVASGVETDKLGPYSEGFELLAIGTNLSGPAHLVIKEFPQGNFLINSSSISSVRALAHGKDWQTIVGNIIREGVARRRKHSPLTTTQ